MFINKRRVFLVLTSFVLTFLILRGFLYFSPGTNLDVGSYNIHHLFTGLLLIFIAGLPLAFFSGNNKIFDLASLTFGGGLSLAMDEWVYLIATDGSDAAYWLPVSYWGAIIAMLIIVFYIVLLLLLEKCRSNIPMEK